MTYSRSGSDGWPGDPVEFGRLIRAMRELLGLSRRQLADRAQVNWFTLRNIEKGCHGTSPDQRARLKAALTYIPREPLPNVGSPTDTDNDG